MSDLRYLICDTETTGPTPEDKVVEVAWVEVDEDLQVLDRQHSLIDPQRAISASASGVHGIVSAMVLEAPTLDEFFQYIYGKRLVGDIVFIAHNAVFDLRYLGKYIDNLVATLCTLRLARRLFPGAENHKLSTLKYELGLCNGLSHRADGDVDTTLDLLHKLVEKSGKSLRDLAQESMEPMLVEIMPFGKHKGTAMRALPKGYLLWLSKLDNLDVDMRFTLASLGVL